MYGRGYGAARRPPVSIAAAGVLSALAMVAWVGILFGEEGGGSQHVMLGEDLALQEELIQAGPAWKKTPESTDWPSTRNPLKDFDKDHKTAEKGFPETTGTADWPFTKNPLLGFDEGFFAKWKGYKGPEKNVYAKLPPNYPFVETKMAPDQAESDYPKWANVGGKPETNVFTAPGYKFPDY
uniref:Uncharacterized protein n=1 Tax=Hemiselmis tepida TaxID=464990 RepID=A0A7S0VN47_9CRYP